MKDNVLFEWKNAAARHSDPSTSHEAARNVEGDKATRMEGKVLATLITHGGLTTHEISEKSGIPYWSCTPRMRPLARKGLIEDSGIRRLSGGGSRLAPSIVWRIKT